MEIRSLVLSQKYQTILKSSNLNIRIFKNTYDFNKSQIEFLYWVDIYTRLFDLLAAKKFKNLTEAVIKNHTRCDAFMVWLGNKVEEDENLEDLKEQLKLPKSASGKALDMKEAFSFNFTKRKKNG